MFVIIGIFDLFKCSFQFKHCMHTAQVIAIKQISVCGATLGNAFAVAECGCNSSRFGIMFDAVFQLEKLIFERNL